MALVPPALRAGYQGYAAAINVTAKLVDEVAIADPTEPTNISASFLGLVNMPSIDTQEGFQPVSTIGAMRNVAMIPGQRSSTVRVPIQVSDLTYFAGASTYVLVRKHALTGSGETALVNGLQLNHLFLGAGRNYGGAFGIVGVDALLNSFSMRMQERQAVMADAEFWPIALIPMATPLAQHVIPVGAGAQPLHWGELSLIVGGNDYRNVLSGVNVGVNNQLYRDGMRNLMLADDGEELCISRTAIGIVPGVEDLQFSLTLKDRWPLGTGNWGSVVATATQPGALGGELSLTVTIGNVFLNHYALQSVPPGQPIAFSVDASAFEISVVAAAATAPEPGDGS